MNGKWLSPSQVVCGPVQRLAWALAGLATAASLSAGAEGLASRYGTGYSNLVAIAQDLLGALEPAQRARFYPVPLWRADDPVPGIRPTVWRVGTQQLWAVEVSAGLIDLLNFLSHAKAIDGVDRGFYRKCVASLAVPIGEAGLPALPISHRKAWAFDTLNHQVSHFNQMAAGLLALQMAYHRLGYYQKYLASQVPADGRPAPIAVLATYPEWLEAVTKGANHALKCGFGIDGLCALFEAFDKLPNRPAWTFEFLPPGARAPKLRRQLVRTEHDFFLVSDVGRDF